jgi:hypothetical protein
MDLSIRARARPCSGRSVSSLARIKKRLICPQRDILFWLWQCWASLQIMAPLHSRELTPARECSKGLTLLSIPSNSWRPCIHQQCECAYIFAGCPGRRSLRRWWVDMTAWILPSLAIQDTLCTGALQGASGTTGLFESTTLVVGMGTTNFDAFGK